MSWFELFSTASVIMLVLAGVSWAVYAFADIVRLAYYDWLAERHETRWERHMYGCDIYEPCSRKCTGKEW